MSSAPTFIALHGLDGAQFDPQTVWREKESTGVLTIPIGVDPTGSPVALDFTRWTSLDDHGAVVGAALGFDDYGAGGSGSDTDGHRCDTQKGQCGGGRDQG